MKSNSFGLRFIQKLSYLSIFNLFGCESHPLKSKECSFTNVFDFLHTPNSVPIEGFEDLSYAEKRKKLTDKNISSFGVISLDKTDFNDVVRLIKMVSFLLFIVRAGIYNINNFFNFYFIEPEKKLKTEFYSYCTWMKKILPTFNIIFVEV